MQNISLKFSRLAIFVVYFWFGLLKLVGDSPATPLVKALFDKTVSHTFTSLSFGQFFLAFAVFEMILGICFLIPKLDKISISLLVLHIFLTSLPLFLLSSMVWTKMWVPTLEGQYIIKNLVILALGLSIFVNSRRNV